MNARRTATRDWPAIIAETDARMERFVAKAGPDDCWPWTASLAGGYGQIKAAGTMIVAHRIAFVRAGGTLQPDQLVRHTCDNRACCNPSHLVPGTHDDNMADMAERRRSTIGERNPRARLTVSQVREIRLSPESTRQAARRLGVSQTAVQEVRTGKRWGRVQ